MFVGISYILHERRPHFEMFVHKLRTTRHNNIAISIHTSDSVAQISRSCVMHQNRISRSFLLVLVFSLISAITIISVSRADFQSSAETRSAKPVGEKNSLDVVPCGVYRDMNWLRKIKLGIAPFVNTALMDKYAVIYKYDAIEVFNAINFKTISEYSKKGKIALTMYDGNTYVPYFSLDFVNKKLLESYNDQGSMLKDDVKLVKVYPGITKVGQLVMQPNADALKWSMLVSSEKLGKLKGMPVVSWMTSAPKYNWGKKSEGCRTGFIFKK